VKTARVISKGVLACLMFVHPALGQGRDKFDHWCDSLQNANLSDLVQFLSSANPAESDPHCLTWTINKLGNEHYDPAVDALVKLLDFRRPPTQREERGFFLHPTGIWDMYPAAGALSLIGKQALPALMGAIRADSTSLTARQNAVFVWMEIFRYGDEHPKGVALLKQEEASANDDSTRQRLRTAVQRALTHCNPPEAVACKEAAETGIAPSSKPTASNR
jgi:hypothetical protein